MLSSGSRTAAKMTLADLMKKSFPNRDFDYGPMGVVCQRERMNRIAGMAKRWKEINAIPAMKDMATDGMDAGHYKILSKIDEAIVRNAADSNDWILRLINQHPPSPEFSLEKVLHQASNIRPGETISSSALWRGVTKQVNLAILEGNKRDWADKSRDVPPLPDLESFEMLRIYGDSRGGFGTWPSTMTTRLAMAGAGWVQVPAENRIIPLYWKHHCDENKIRYKLAVPGNTSPKDLKRMYMSSSLSSLDRTTAVTTAAASSVENRPPVSFPGFDLVAEDQAVRKPDTHSKVQSPADPLEDMRAVDEFIEHHTSTTKDINEAIELDGLASKVPTEDRMGTKKDLESLVNEEVEARKNAQVSAMSPSNATLPFLHGEEVHLGAHTSTKSSVFDISDDLSKPTKSEDSNGPGQHQPQNVVQEPDLGSKTGLSLVFLSHCKNGAIIALEAVALYVLCDTPLGFWLLVS